MDSSTACLDNILIDLSEPAPPEEDFALLTDSRETTRRESISVSKPSDFESHVALHEPKDQSSPAKQSESDTRLIDEEVFDFDFDLPVSPERVGNGGDRAKTTAEDEEEVFLGPVGFREKCIAAGVEEETFRPLSPLTPGQMAELFKEAYSVAYRIENMKMSESSDYSPAQSTRSAVHRRLGSMFKQAQGDRPASPKLGKEAAENQENISPRKRLRSGTFTKDSPTNDDEENTGKDHKRKGTFTKEESVESLVSASNIVSSGKLKTAIGKAVGIPKRGAQTGSRLQPPSSKLRRFNNSQPDLAKLKPVVREAAGSEDTGKRDTAAPGPVPAGASRLQLPRAGSAPKLPQQEDEAEEPHKVASAGGPQPDANRKQPLARPSKLTVKRAQSLSMKSALPSTRGSKLALPSYRTAAPSAQTTGPSNADKEASKQTAVKLKGPTTKLQLMQPGQLQRKSFALGRGKGVTPSQTGPLKAPHPSKAKMGDTVERPYNPALAAAAAAGNSQCPSTPAAQKKVQPKILSISSQGSTPARSSCSSSSVCGSTPGSVSKKLSLLPTSSQCRSMSGSMPPPSPMSVRSSGSSISRRSLVSSSDACDSPVFDSKSATKIARSRRSSGVKESCTSSDLDGPGASPFAFKSRKPLVQNTPDLPKRKLSRWSPLRKPKPALLEDQVSMCTKRLAHK